MRSSNIYTRELVRVLGISRSGVYAGPLTDANQRPLRPHGAKYLIFHRFPCGLWLRLDFDHRPLPCDRQLGSVAVADCTLRSLHQGSDDPSATAGKSVLSLGRTQTAVAAVACLHRFSG